MTKERTSSTPTAEERLAPQVDALADHLRAVLGALGAEAISTGAEAMRRRGYSLQEAKSALRFAFNRLLDEVVREGR